MITIDRLGLGVRSLLNWMCRDAVGAARFEFQGTGLETLWRGYLHGLRKLPRRHHPLDDGVVLYALFRSFHRSTWRSATAL